MTTYTLTELFDKRSELAGLIEQAEKQAKQYREDLAHVEATIRILRPGIELPKIVKKRVGSARATQRAQMARYRGRQPRRNRFADVVPGMASPILIRDASALRSRKSGKVVHDREKDALGIRRYWRADANF
jgi:hypothetical protein